MGRSKLVGLLALAALVGIAGCQEKAAGPKVSDYQAKRKAALEKAKKDRGLAPAQLAQAPGQPQAEPEGEGLGGQGYIYDPTGRKDPFRSFILERVQEIDPLAKGPLEQFDLAQLSVTGVVWEGDIRRAFVVDPSGHGYIVREGDRIGKNDGQVVEIGDSRMLVREAYVDFHGEKTTKEIEIRIRQSQGG